MGSIMLIVYLSCALMLPVVFGNAFESRPFVEYERPRAITRDEMEHFRPYLINAAYFELEDIAPVTGFCIGDMNSIGIDGESRFERMSNIYYRFYVNGCVGNASIIGQCDHRCKKQRPLEVQLALSTALDGPVQTYCVVRSVGVIPDKERHVMEKWILRNSLNKFGLSIGDKTKPQVPPTTYLAYRFPDSPWLQPQTHRQRVKDSYKLRRDKYRKFKERFNREE